MSYYKHHVFFCLNKREPPAACCANHNAEAMKDHAKKRVKQLKLKGEGGVRIEDAFTGRANLFAEAPGVLVVDRAAVDRLNRVDEAITFATLPAFKPVVAGEMIATVKIIPFAVSGRARDAGKTVCRRCRSD